MFDFIALLVVVGLIGLTVAYPKFGLILGLLVLAFLFTLSPRSAWR